MSEWKLPPEPDLTGWDSLRYILRFPDKCCAEVTRGGETQPCDKPAVAVADGSAEYGDSAWWPVCPHHSRGRKMVPLDVLINTLDYWRHFAQKWVVGIGDPANIDTE